jgi:hypothetical protein
MVLLRNNFPMEEAYKSAFSDRILAAAIADAQKSVTDNIKARGSRPPEAGAASTPAFAVKDDVSKLSDKDVLEVLAQINSGRKVTFG